MGKLLKHDLKHLFHTALPIIIVVCVTTLLSVLGNFLLMNFFTDLDGGFASTMILLSVSMLTAVSDFVSTIGIALIALMGPYRYYKSLFTDEGYLTLVLPISLSGLQASKFLTGVIFTAGAMLFSTLDFVLEICLFAGGEVMGLFVMLTDLFGILAFENGIIDVGAIVYTVYTVLVVVITLFSQLPLLYFAITVANLVIKKLRLFFVFGIAGGVAFFLGFFYFLIEILLIGALAEVAAPMLIAYLSSTLMLLIFGGTGTGCYFATTYLLKNKLNLE